MTRFFVAGTNLGGGRAILTGADAEHIRVLRMKAGEELIICDGSGTDYLCHFVSYADKQAELSVVSSSPSKSEASVSVSIYAGLPKGERLDFIVQKCTEAGATDINFFVSERCVAKPKMASMDAKLERWQRIAESAAQQSGRGIVPKVNFLFNYVDMLDAAIKKDKQLFLYETGDDRVSLKTAINSSDAKSYAIITGPEGGFTKAEADMARGVGFSICSLGERILRCETAPLVALNCVMYDTGNLE